MNSPVLGTLPLGAEPVRTDEKAVISWDLVDLNSLVAIDVVGSV